MSQHCVPLEILEMIEARHATACLSQDSRQLAAGQPGTDVHQARSGVGTFTIDAVTAGAMLDVRVTVVESNRNLVQTNDAADLLGIEDESIAVRVEGRAAPFRTTIVRRVEERAGLRVYRELFPGELVKASVRRAAEAAFPERSVERAR